MSIPTVGQEVETDFGMAVVEHVYWRVTYPNGGLSGYICTVRLATPYQDKARRNVERIEHIVPDQEP